jgi:hypothetical protein
MKKGLWMVAVSMMCCACTTGQYRLSEYEKGKLKGYHANEANRLIEANKKNRKANQKAAEKNRQEQSARLNELNRSSREKKPMKNTKVPF